jgi:hypothetical protein
MERAVRCDYHEIPLVPQPSSDPMDPLNWKPWIKSIVLVEVSLLSFLSLLSASLILGGSLSSPITKYRTQADRQVQTPAFILPWPRSFTSVSSKRLT